MADAPRIAAKSRTEFGKGAARRVRRAHEIPAVLYGHGTDPVHLRLPGHEMMMITKTQNAVVNLDIEGTQQLALVKDVQRDIIKPVIEHIDLVIVKKGEKVVVEIPVHVEGEAAPETVVTTDIYTLQLEVEATDIPESVTVSVEGLPAGTQILAGAVELPKGATLVTDAEALVVNVTAMISEEALEAELAESEAGIEQEEAGAEAGESGEAAAEAAADEKAADA